MLEVEALVHELLSFSAFLVQEHDGVHEVVIGGVSEGEHP